MLRARLGSRIPDGRCCFTTTTSRSDTGIPEFGMAHVLHWSVSSSHLAWLHVLRRSTGSYCRAGNSLLPRIGVGPTIRGQTRDLLLRTIPAQRFCAPTKNLGPYNGPMGGSNSHALNAERTAEEGDRRCDRRLPATTLNSMLARLYNRHVRYRNTVLAAKSLRRDAQAAKGRFPLRVHRTARSPICDGKCCRSACHAVKMVHGLSVVDAP